MRLLVECSECRRQFDASRRKVGSRFRCQCGHIVSVRRPEGHDALVVRCSSCGAARSEGALQCSYCAAQFTLHERDLNTVCPHCLARVSDRARFCHHCGTGLVVEQSAGNDSEMACPACGDAHRLVSRHIGAEHVTVLECGQCAGFWLGHEAFRQFIERAQNEVLPAGTLLDSPQQVAAKFGLPSGTAAPEPHERGWQYRPCVVCGELMNRRNYGHGSGVIVDLCRNHGVWFDADELARILMWLRAGGTEPAPAKDKPSTANDEAMPHPAKGFFIQLIEAMFPPRGRDW